MKKTLQLAGSLFLCFVFISLFHIIFYMYQYRYSFPSAVWRFIYSFESDTKFANEFSERQFSNVRIGMSEEEVISLIGKPLGKNCFNYGCNWVYSWKIKGNSDHFDLRSVFFDTDDVVIRVRHEFFLN
jgi:outer membrane protein assembly factor BamE (lipoprotein component of BamABCDE complex)